MKDRVSKRLRATKSIFWGACWGARAPNVAFPLKSLCVNIPRRGAHALPRRRIPGSALGPAHAALTSRPDAPAASCARQVSTVPTEAAPQGGRPATQRAGAQPRVLAASPSMASASVEAHPAGRTARAVALAAARARKGGAIMHAEPSTTAAVGAARAAAHTWPPHTHTPPRYLAPARVESPGSDPGWRASDRMCVWSCSHRQRRTGQRRSSSK